MNKKRSIFTQLTRLVLLTALLGQILYVPNLFAAASDTAYLVLGITGGVYDTTAPDAVTNLSAGPHFITGVNGSSDNGGGKVKLSWTAPADMPAGTPVYSYIIKYATFSIYDVNSDTIAWWNHSSVSTVAANSGLPNNWGIKEYSLPHSSESFVVTGLQSSKYYWFAIQSVDNVFNHSPMDTKAQFIVFQSSSYASSSSTAPAAVTNLIASPTKDVPGGITLNWTAMGNDEVSNRIIDGRYRICYSTTQHPMVDSDLLKADPLAYWNQAKQVYISTSNVYPGASQTVLLTGLQTSVSFYFWIWTSDEWYAKTNWSHESNKAISRAFNFYPPNEVAPLYGEAFGSIDLSSGSYVSLNWKNPQISATKSFDGVKICYSTVAYPTDKDSSPSIALSGLTANDWFTYSHLQLEPRTTYFYRIYSFDTADPVLYSGTGTLVSVYTVYDNIAPDAVSGLALNTDANVSKGTYISLNWTHPDFDRALYQNHDWEKTAIYVSTQNFVKNGGNSYNNIAPIELPIATTCYEFTNLNPQNTYYYEIRTYDPVGNFSVSTATIYTWKDIVPPGVLENLAIQSAWSEDIDIGCTLTVSYKYPKDVDLDRAYINYRDDKYPSNSADGFSFIKIPQSSTDTVERISELIGNNTYYFSIFLYDWSGNMSSTTISGIVNVPRDNTMPFTPLGLTTTKDTTTFNMSWSQVAYQRDISSINVLTAITTPKPKSSEIYRYQIYESADMNAWHLIASTKPVIEALGFKVPLASQIKYYKVRSVDICGNFSDSMIADNSDDLNIYSMIADRSYVKMDKEIKAVISDVYLKWTRNEENEKGPIFRSFTIEPYRILNGKLEFYQDFKFEKPKAQVAITYDKQTISSRGSQMSKVLAEPEKWLSLFFYNGKEWVKLASSIDAQKENVKSDVKYIGRYQIRYAMNSTELTNYEVIPKIITPNNDGRNDKAFFRFDNPRGALVTIKIFDMTGLLIKTIADITENSNVPGGYISWDGADKDMNVVAPGTYIYQIEGEGKVYNGTIVVAR
ncbi:MAG: gliding motility-associated C-terminal domain-containing protein [Elusimicrobia bacterium]|nr:gliding motility-associated C-terminal domain-containing protein [Elusimicrobiota bacterium]